MKWPWQRRAEEAVDSADEAKRNLARARAARIQIERQTAVTQVHREINHLAELFYKGMQGDKK